MFAHLMRRKRRETASLASQGILEEHDSEAQEECEVKELPPPNGFGGSSGDYMRARLSQIPADKVDKMLGRFPHVRAEMEISAANS